MYHTYTHTLSAICAICWIAELRFLPIMPANDGICDNHQHSHRATALLKDFTMPIRAHPACEPNISAEYTNRPPIHYDSPSPPQPPYIKAGYSVRDRGDNLVDKETPN